MLRTAALAALLGLMPVPAAAEIVVLNVDSGATFDAIIDGYPMLAALDGQPDFPTGYNTLSVALQTNVTEERGVGEFPLGPLDRATSADVAAATLTFNIDDVITTFGPGTGFSGAAARALSIHLYAGNGKIDVDDFLGVARPPHVVDTQPLGRITDQSLAESGILIFEVDVTDDVRAFLDGAAESIGVVWRTNDSPTATSLDHLGDGSLGPPGANGSFLPYLTIELAAPETPTPTASPLPAGPTSSPTTRTGPCPGDCDGDDAVTVNELILGVNMAGGSGGTCPALDGDGNHTITVSELVQAVNAALNGC